MTAGELGTAFEQSLRDLQAETIDLLQLHTWIRAWNCKPTALEVLRTMQKEGKIQGIGISTPEHDQNSLIDLMRGGCPTSWKAASASTSGTRRCGTREVAGGRWK